VILKRETAQGPIGCVVPLHRELAIGTLHGILQQAGLSAEEFMEKL
jgi:predicted RNA binding protein YcfA (HicA-like mRNA interferase family)